MLISLDHDGTYTLAPKYWDAFIKFTHRSGHHVHIVTLRSATDDKLKSQGHLEKLGCHVVYCNGRPKVQVARANGTSYNVWIEDDPRCIHEGSRLSPEQLAKWRTLDVYADRKHSPLRRRPPSPARKSRARRTSLLERGKPRRSVPILHAAPGRSSRRAS